MITDMSLSRPNPTRQTRQRELVYRIVASTSGHPTADWIYAEARKLLPSVSLGTVYRNLQVLDREGRLRAIDSWGKPTRYDADLSDHYHFVCLGCGSISDLPKPPDGESRLAPLVRARGFVVTGHKLEFEGYCPDCGKKRKA
jgi:Fur family peroxide stress response transcriptional regulator